MRVLAMPLCVLVATVTLMLPEVCCRTQLGEERGLI